MGTKHKGSRKDVRALDAYINLVRAADSVASKAAAHLAHSSLTISQFGVLDVLYHIGPMHQTDIAEKVLKTSGNMTMVIDNLQKRGLVERERDIMDRRCITVLLTDRGRELFEDIFPAHVEMIARLFSPLTSVEQQSLRILCRKLGLAAQAGDD
jgi:MarR family 2-MHQ and catechol resistance regulon transcriptional repressor